MSVWWMHLAASTVGFTVGSLLLKKYADAGGVPCLVLTALVLVASNVSFVEVIRGGFGQGIIASSMVQMILMVALGAVLFGETYSPAQGLGVILAVMSMYLILGAGPDATHG